MTEITELRSLLRDRQQKSENRPKVSYEICLDDDAVEKYNELRAQRADLDKDDAPVPDRRLGGTPTKAKLDKEIAAQEAVVQAASLRLVFRALNATRYQELVDEHPKVSDGGKPFLDFCDALAAECYEGCYRGDSDTKEEISLEELHGGLTFGEWEPIRSDVLALNRTKVDIPFSKKPSRKTRR